MDNTRPICVDQRALLDLIDVGRRAAEELAWRDPALADALLGSTAAVEADISVPV
jgi:hypothetical protein